MPYKTGDETPPELREWALARIRQLVAHEVGHTLGLGHNYYDSDAGRISVMDYPHPLVTLKADGTLDYSKVYAAGIGEWDKVAITYGYRISPTAPTKPTALAAILDEAWKKDLRYMTNQDTSANPRVDQWSNGTDPAAELTRMMACARAALARFGEQAIKRGRPMATDRGSAGAALPAPSLSGRSRGLGARRQHYIYAMRGDGREPVKSVPAGEQRAALEALMATLKPSELALPSARAGADPAAAGRIRHAPRAVPALHRLGVRRDHAGGGRGRSGHRRTARSGARGAPGRAARAGSRAAGAGDVIERLRDATLRKQARTAYERRSSGPCSTCWSRT